MTTISKPGVRAPASFGPEAIDVLIDLLKEAEPNLQYGALMALRQLGVEAWGHDYEPNLYYEVTVPGREPQRITPLLQAPPLLG